MPPPRSTKAPKSGTETTRPVSTAPGTIDLRTSSALARCCSSRCLRRETTTFSSAVLVLDDRGTCRPGRSCTDGSAVRMMSICENGQNARSRAIRTSYPPLTAFSTLPSTASPARNASSSSRCVAALRTPLRESTIPPLVETTIAWMRSPTDTSTSPSASFSSARSTTASALPPTSTKASFGPNPTMVPSTVWPRSNRRALTDASNIVAKSSSCSLTAYSS